MYWPSLTLALVASSALLAAADPIAEDTVKELAEAVGKDFIDPAEHERVDFDFTLRTVWGGATEQRMGGWRDSKSGALFLDDGFSVPDPDKRNAKPAAMEDLITAAGGKEEDNFALMKRNAMGIAGETRIPRAAWLAASGDLERAKELLKAVESEEKQTHLGTWRSERIWFHFAAMVHAFMQGQDDAALAHGQFLEARYPELAAEQQPQAFELLADLRRRKAGAKPLAAEAIPALPPDRQIAAWIGRLEDIAVPQDGQPGGVDLAEAPEVQALIRIGEPAIPALLDCFEHDIRLTRSVHFWRDFHRSRTVLGVHEAALTAIMSILRTEFYSPAATGSNVTAGGHDERKQLSTELRAYWDHFGKMTFDERMMAVLTDRKAKPDARQEAAANLATPHARETYGTTVWTGSWENPGGRNPWIEKFANPSIFEAILGALDDEIAAIHAEAKRRRDAGVTEEDRNVVFPPDKRPVDIPYETRRVARFFAGVLGDLQDPRAAGAMSERAAKTEDPAIRSWLAMAAGRLGDPSALAELARQVVAKDLRAPDTDDHTAFTALYDALGTDPDTRRNGLAAIAKRDHPWFPCAVDRVLMSSPFDSDSDRCLHDPWCLTLLEEALQDTRETGFTDLLQKDGEKWELFHREPNGNGASYDGTPFLDESKYDRSWNLRMCDRAYQGLLELLGDHTQDTYQPLAKDREDILNELRSYLARHRGTFREMSDHLDGGTGFAMHGGRFLPMLPPLDRAATTDDVAAGRALFHLPDAGAKPAIRTPVESEWFGQKGSAIHSDNRFHGRRVVILQIERDEHGALWFGIADGNGFHVVPSQQIGVLQSIPGTPP